MTRSAEAVAAMLCPVCKSGLAMSERQGIEIDYCPGCRGVWLDRGELDKIVERSVAETAPRPGATPPTTKAYRRDDDAYPPRRRKSFLSDLFD
ncbi:zf-TFIIB domain-containing protein [Desertibaculum subflavum]|uniref:TFIIB-type zinc ribbon-containing protein n=1 Tax=Desertibaculum subflavum TaxID=2268458 RepID=UPI000E660D42